MSAFDEQNLVAPVGEVCRHIDGEGGFTDAAFLIQERDDHLPPHISLFVVMCKYGSVDTHILGYRPARGLGPGLSLPAALSWLLGPSL